MADPIYPQNRTASGRCRVLVVDDNQDAADTVAQLLTMLGHEAAVAHDGAAALARLSGFAPQLVLLDIGLPDMNGYEVARRIRQMHDVSQPRLVALTGWGRPQDKQLARDAGFDDHWTKPVDPARLQQLPWP
jgi:CheY-like chemotaxis protein